MLLGQRLQGFGLATVTLAAALATSPARAEPPATDPAITEAAVAAPPAMEPAPTVMSGGNAISNYFEHWFDRVRQAQASQPHWMTPLVTITPRLEEEVRTDFFFEKLGNGATIDSYFNAKGLELIPTTTNEIILNVPAYQDRYGVAPASGFADWPFILVKQRLLSANEQSGNYIVTAFLTLQADTGSRAFNSHAWFVTPTIAGGKGWGDFDVQATSSVTIPSAHEHTFGTAVATNVTFQYHLLKYFWPEFEVNWTWWADGLRGGKNQVFLTPGIIFGRFNLTGRINAIFGFGYQSAVSPKLIERPALTPIYNHAWIVTTRITF